MTLAEEIAAKLAEEAKKRGATTTTPQPIEQPIVTTINSQTLQVKSGSGF